MEMISEFKIENKDVKGNMTVQYVHVYKNGVVVITRFTVVDCKIEPYLGFEKVKTMFGKSVLKQMSSYRLSTLKSIYIESMAQLIKSGVKLSDLA